MELTAALDELGFQAEWTDSGAGAVCEAAAGDIALCVVGLSRQSEEQLGYLSCLNQVDPWLPVIVVNDCDSLETQRKVRSHRSSTIWSNRSTGWRCGRSSTPLLVNE